MATVLPIESQSVPQRLVISPRPRPTQMNDHLTRWHIDNPSDPDHGFFIDRDSLVGFRHFGYRYSVWQSGTGELQPAGYRIAGFRGGADTLKAALELLVRMAN
jgi:hypothetical protein